MGDNGSGEKDELVGQKGMRDINRFLFPRGTVGVREGKIVT